MKKEKEIVGGLKTVTNKIINIYCLPEFAVGLFTAMINNYLIYFYQPSDASGLPTLITQGAVILGVLTVVGAIKALGHVIDAVTDPLVASLSDKSKNKKGRRIPYMRWAAVPFGISALFIFMAPASKPGMLNNIWLAIFLWAYYVFYTLYMVPHGALLPEMIPDGEKRVNAYTMNSLYFVVGSAAGYVTPLLVDIWKKLGLSALASWRLTFGIFTVIGIVLLLLPTFVIKETEYVRSVRPTISLKESIKHAFKNKHFRIVTLGQLLEGTGLSIFEACIMYYVTSLMGMPESNSVIILAVSIAGSLALYPLINKMAKKFGKKKLMVAGCLTFAIAEFVICLVDYIPGNAMVVAIIFALFVSFPFAVLNILPGSMMADVIQYDTVVTKVNQEGIFSAARSFITKMGTSIAIMIVPSLTIIGATTGENIGKSGLKITAIVGGVFCLAAVIVYSIYKEKEVLKTIDDASGEKKTDDAEAKG